MKNLNWKIIGRSAWHVAAIFATVLIMAEFMACPVWLRVGYGAAFLAAWILTFKIESALHARRQSRRGDSLHTSNPASAQLAAVRVVPASIALDSDSAIDAEESAIYALMNIGYPRAEAAKIARASAPLKKVTQNFLVDFENHSSKARA